MGGESWEEVRKRVRDFHTAHSLVPGPVCKDFVFDDDLGRLYFLSNAKTSDSIQLPIVDESPTNGKKLNLYCLDCKSGATHSEWDATTTSTFSDQLAEIFDGIGRRGYGSTAQPVISESWLLETVRLLTGAPNGADPSKERKRSSNGVTFYQLWKTPYASSLLFSLDNALFYGSLKKTEVEIVSLERPGIDATIERFKYPRVGKANAFADLKLSVFWVSPEGEPSDPIIKALYGVLNLKSLFPWLEYIPRAGWLPNNTG
ncbi:dipeptidylpeptidase [Phlyctochytrium bullatum]|nr:dipeptidylpeptidase [Phlyctochytrium bullatum]